MGRWGRGWSFALSGQPSVKIPQGGPQAGQFRKKETSRGMNQRVEGKTWLRINTASMGKSGTVASNLESSYRLCELRARQSGSSFFLAFQTLPRRMYRQMCVLYAFMRQTDDLGDQPETPLFQRREALCAWKMNLQKTLATGESEDSVLAAMADVARKQGIPEKYLYEVIDGVSSDLTAREFETFPQLEHYCYQVAGVVGLCCLKIWEKEYSTPPPAALACGTAFQLTNILRDLKEDADRGRIYLPRQEMAAFRYSPDDLRAGRNNAAFRELMAFQVHRAWTFYQQAHPLAAELSPPGRRIFLAFFDVYSHLLREIERVDYDVFSQRIHLSRWKKTRVVLSCLLRLEPRISSLTPARSVPAIFPSS